MRRTASARHHAGEWVGAASLRLTGKLCELLNDFLRPRLAGEVVHVLRKIRHGLQDCHVQFRTQRHGAEGLLKKLKSGLDTGDTLGRGAHHRGRHGRRSSASGETGRGCRHSWHRWHHCLQIP